MENNFNNHKNKNIKMEFIKRTKENTCVKISLEEKCRVERYDVIDESTLRHAWVEFEEYHKAVMDEILSGLGFDFNKRWDIIADEMELYVPFSFIDGTYAKWTKHKDGSTIMITIPVSDQRQMKKYYSFLSELEWFMTAYFGYLCIVTFEFKTATRAEIERTNRLLRIE